MEAIFQRLKGVESVTSWYSGGTKPNPTYEDVCYGNTGHIEVIQVSFDSTVITYQQLLEVFFTMHDPSSKDQQGNDVGIQYRSIIFVHDDQQQKTAEAVIADLNTQKIRNTPIVTEIRPFEVFYKADIYHQNYFNNNPMQPYCSYVIEPKLTKLREKRRSLLIPQTT